MFILKKTINVDSFERSEICSQRTRGTESFVSDNLLYPELRKMTRGPGTDQYRFLANETLLKIIYKTTTKYLRAKNTTTLNETCRKSFFFLYRTNTFTHSHLHLHNRTFVIRHCAMEEDIYRPATRMPYSK